MSLMCDQLVKFIDHCSLQLFEMDGIKDWKCSRKSVNLPNFFPLVFFSLHTIIAREENPYAIVYTLY